MVHAFTHTAVYPGLSITKSDMENITESRGSMYRVIIKTFNIMNGLDFFNATDESNVARGGRVVSILHLVYDIKSNYISCSGSQKHSRSTRRPRQSR